MEDKIATSFTVNRELHKKFKIAAIVKGMRISDLMEEALNNYIETLEMDKWVHVTTEHPKG